MSWDSDSHAAMGESQDDPNAIDNMVDKLRQTGKSRPHTFGELAKQLKAEECQTKSLSPTK